MRMVIKAVAADAEEISRGPAAIAQMSDGKARIEMILDKKTSRPRAFTLVEIIIVVAIIAIGAFLAVPMFSSAADVQLRAAANIIAADIEYAKSLAITRQRPHSVVVDTVNNAYEVRDENGSVVVHPLNSGGILKIEFPKDSRLNKVSIASTTLTDNTVTFDYLGNPWDGPDTTSPLVSGDDAITLSADGVNSMTISIEPVTGYVTIN